MQDLPLEKLQLLHLVNLRPTKLVELYLVRICNTTLPVLLQQHTIIIQRQHTEYTAVIVVSLSVQFDCAAVTVSVAARFSLLSCNAAYVFCRSFQIVRRGLQLGRPAKLTLRTRQ